RLLLLRTRPPCPTPFPYTTLFRSMGIRQRPSAAQSPVWIVRLRRPRLLAAAFCSAARFSSLSSSCASALSSSRGQLGRLPGNSRSEEHTSELQSRENLVCRLLPEK